MPPTQTDLTNWSIFALNPTTWIDVVLNFVIALLSAFVISVIYRQCRGLHATRSFIQTLYMLTLVIALVMMVIMSVRGTAGVAVAFGLMGALSIIRFRTIVKDNRDTAFVFLAVGTGMAAGTGMWWIGFAGLVVIGITLLLTETAPWHRGRRRVIVKITFRPTGEHESSQLLGALQQLGTQVNMMHLRTIRLGEELEATYSLTLLPSVEEAYAVESLMKLTSVDDINIFSADELEEP
jgi:uncharacterized membrane protein YhiD involved in acid resistance